MASLSITLDPALERALTDLAMRQRRPKEEIAAEALAAFIEAEQVKLPAPLQLRRKNAKAEVDHESAIERLRRAAGGGVETEGAEIVWSKSALAALELAVAARRREDEKAAHHLVDGIEKALDALARQRRGRMFVKAKLSASTLGIAPPKQRFMLPWGNKESPRRLAIARREDDEPLSLPAPPR